ncbi:MAG TPA: hypothetical protein PLE35_08430, partial [Lentisphaeria bacterium]|nr:hypothetical protein [Lentisphaeria bacterium]
SHGKIHWGAPEKSGNALTPVANAKHAHYASGNGIVRRCGLKARSTVAKQAHDASEYGIVRRCGLKARSGETGDRAPLSAA